MLRPLYSLCLKPLPLMKDAKTSFTEQLLIQVIILSLEHPQLVG